MTELKDVAARKGWAWPGGLTHTWTVYLGPGQVFCQLATINCTGGNTHARGEHSFIVPSGENDYLVYAVITYAWDRCMNEGSPNDNPPADTAINVTSHEFFEMQTDPLGNGWCGTTLESTSCGETEIGDKCAWIEPVFYAVQDANQTWGGRYYLIQAEWANHWAEKVVPEEDVSADPHCVVPGNPVL